MEFCTNTDRATLELSVFSKDCVSFSRCSYLKPLAYLKYDAIKDIDIFNFDYIDNICKKSSTLCSVKCRNLSEKVENIKIGISKACNHSCVHCFNKCHTDNREDKEIYFYLLDLAKNHNFTSLILGHQGEVFLYFEEITNYLKTLSTKDFKKVIFQTNISLLDEFRINYLKGIANQTGLEYIFMPSIDGITEKTYNDTTKSQDYYKVIDNLKRLIDVFGRENVRVSFTIKETNVEDLPNINYFFKDLGVLHINVSYDLFNSRCRELYLGFLNKGHLKCIYDTACLMPTIKSKGIKKYAKITDTSLLDKQIYLSAWKDENNDPTISDVINMNASLKTEKIVLDNSYEDILTVGITLHKEQEISQSLLHTIENCSQIQFLFSNDAGQEYNNNIKTFFTEKKNVKFIYSKPGIENNRQNILDNTFSKYIYIIDYDDEFNVDEEKLLSILKNSICDILTVNPYENGSNPDYIYYSDTQFFVVTWAQIFSTNFIRQLGGYIQTWNFYHEEFGTNANALANIYSRNIVYDIDEIADDEIIYYNHILTGTTHNSTLKKKVKDIFKFVSSVPKNDRITYKKLFLSIFKERTSLLGLSDKDYKKLLKIINTTMRKIK